MTARTVWRLNFTGWLLFTVSACLFLWTTWHAGDLVGILASLAFLVACIVFLIPVWVHRPDRSGHDD
ncbi:hypothetical protein EI983_07715 [Roseovarius faecimaris]|uniref:Cytochrome oxidase subunit III n=1 Tax=Roseovarius faecimaris TaxID=2494550 RepID=A0A6I6IM54_9RHOB|nr:hypothetical protein [Roseovarius faecimaris]QGX98170.1 hypothetical protein EI983_07715 [Roseovarius faecimaris]